MITEITLTHFNFENINREINSIRYMYIRQLDVCTSISAVWSIRIM